MKRSNHIDIFYRERYKNGEKMEIINAFGIF